MYKKYEKKEYLCIAAPNKEKGKKIVKNVQK